jgi:hypothetical protein
MEGEITQLERQIQKIEEETLRLQEKHNQNANKASSQQRIQ